MPSSLEKLDKIIETIEKNIVGYATLGIVAIIFVNVVLRRLGGGLPWAYELSSYLNILAVYFAISAGFKYGSHVSVSVFVDYVVPKPLRKPAAILGQIIVLTFCMLVFWQAIKMSMTQFANGQVSPVLKLPLGFIYAIVILGMFMSCIRVLMETVKIINKKEEA